MLRHTAALGAARFAVTDRLGGVSEGPYASLNLAQHVGDDPAAVSENRRRVVAALGPGVRDLVVAQQVHGTAVVTVTGPWAAGTPVADALVCAVPGVAIGVLVADCTPVMLAAPAESVVGVAHAGRQGAVDGVVPALVRAMRRAGAGELVGRVGPSICARCYEVPAALRDEVSAVLPVTRSVDRYGAPALDVCAGVLDQLAGLDVSVEAWPGCSREDPQLFSHRGAGGTAGRPTGRYAGLAWLP